MAERFRAEKVNDAAACVGENDETIAFVYGDRPDALALARRFAASEKMLEALKWARKMHLALSDAQREDLLEGYEEALNEAIALAEEDDVKRLDTRDWDE